MPLKLTIVDQTPVHGDRPARECAGGGKWPFRDFPRPFSDRYFPDFIILRKK